MEFQQAMQGAELFLQNHAWIVVIVSLWSLAWKGLALWKASRLSHKTWFIVLLVANTIGILDIIYIYFVARKYDVVTKTEVGSESEQQK